MDSDERERHFNLHTTPEVMAGVYANFATVSHSDYEFTLTFSRVDHEVEADEVPGVVVSRVSLSPQAMRELIDAMEDNWSKWRTTRGHQAPAGDQGPAGLLVAQRAPGRSAPSWAGGCRAAICCQRGGSGSPTFWIVIRRSKATIASGSLRQVERERVGAALDRARELVGDRRQRGRDERQRERDGGDGGASRARQALGQRGRPRASRTARPARATAGRAGRRGSARGRARGRRRAASRRA